MEGTSNWKPNEQGGDSLASNNANNWRSQFEPDQRKKVVLAIVETLKRYYPTQHPNAIKSAALSSEGRIYGEATDNVDYMRKIKGFLINFSKQIITVQSNNVQSGSSVNGTNPPDPAAQALNQMQSIPTSLPYIHTPTSLQWLPQNNIQSNLNIPDSSGLHTQNLNIQMGEGVHSNLLPGSQRQIHGREQFLSQQPQSSNYFQNQMDQQPSYMQQQLPHQTLLSSQQNSQLLSRQNQFPTQRVHSSHLQQQMYVPSQGQKRKEREQQLISHLKNGQDTQQNHLTSLQSNGDPQGGFRVSSSHQNNIVSFQEWPQQNSNIQNMHQQQRLFSHTNAASALPSQHQQYNARQSQPMIQQQYQPQHHVQQQQPQNIILQQPFDDTQRFQASGSLLQTQTLADQQNQPYQLHRTAPENTAASQDNTSGGDWQEETYQKIKALKEKYIHALNNLFQKLSKKLLELDSVPQQKTLHEPIEKLRASQAMMKQVLLFLSLPRDAITEIHRDKFSVYEAHLLRFVNPKQTRRQVQQQQQQQQVCLPPSQTHQTALQSQSGHHQIVHVLDSPRREASPSLSALTTSHTAMPLQKKPKIEPKEESNIMTSSGHVLLPSLKQNPPSNTQTSKQFHHLPVQQQPQANHQQLQKPKTEMSDVRMRRNLSENQNHLAKPLASPARKSKVSPPDSSPQVLDQQILPTTLNKTGTSSQPGASSFVSPSPNPGDPENHITVESPSSHGCQLQEEAAKEPSPLPPESTAERPIDRLIKAIKSASPESLAQSVSEMSTVMSLTDRIAGSVQSIGGSEAGLPEDLSETTRLHLQQGETDPTNKRFKRHLTSQARDITSETDSYKQFSSLESEVDSTASSVSKVNKIEPGCALLQEIKEVNGRLIETVVSICNEDVSPCEVTTGTIVTCSYTPVALCDAFKALYKSGHISQIQPLRLLVPTNYPDSPILIENTPSDSSVYKHEDLSARTRMRFGLSIKEFPEPMSLAEIAKSWNASARATLAEYAERHGGGTFSSKYGQWESVVRP